MAIGDNRISIIVKLRAEQFQRGLKQVQGGLKGLNRTIGAFSTAFIGAQLFNLAKMFVDSAGEMENVERSFARSFAGVADSAETELNKLAKSLNRNETALKKGAVSFNAFFSGLGFVSQEASKMSVKMQRLSLDLASFFGISDQNAQKRFLAALAGSPEVLDQFGINLKQSALQLELYRMGLKTTVQNTNEVVKTQGRLNIIMKAMTDAGILGDATRGMDTYQGQIKQLQGAFKNLSEGIGGVFIPVVTDAIKVLNKLFIGAEKFFGVGDEELKKQAEAIRNRVDRFSQEQIIERKVELTTVKKETQEDKDVGLMTELESIEDARLRILSEEQLLELSKLTLHLEEVNGLIEQANRFEEDTKALRIASNDISVKKAEIDKLVADQLKKERKVREQFLLDQKSELENKEALAKLDEEFIKNSKLTIPELEKQLELEKSKLELAKEQVRLTGQSDENVEILERRVIALTELTRRLQEIPDISKKGRFLIEREDVLQPRGDILTISDEESMNNIGVILGLGTKDQQEKAFQDLMARKTKFLNDLAQKNKEGLAKVAEQNQKDGINMIQILRPITDALAQVYTQMVTPPDPNLSPEEQRAQTLKAFGGIIVGLGEAMMSLGMGSLLLTMALPSLGQNPALAVALIGMGAGLIKMGKGKLAQAQQMSPGRSTGGGANSGSGTSHVSMMDAIQGEHVFRLAGNDLVTALNRSNNFQGSIGG